MNETETVARPPDTLVGLGPPPPLEGFDEGTEAPGETLRPWATSADSSTDTGAAAEEPFVPLEPLLPSSMWRSVARPALFIAAALIAVTAVVSMAMIFRARSPLLPRRVAAGHSESTSAVVGNPRVLPPSPEVEREGPQNALAGEPRPSFKELPKPLHRSSPATRLPANPKESANPSVAADRARIQAIADAVLLEDDSARPEGREAAEPEEAGPGAR